MPFSLLPYTELTLGATLKGVDQKLTLGLAGEKPNDLHMDQRVTMDLIPEQIYLSWFCKCMN